MKGSTRWLWTSPILTRYGLKLELGHFIISGTKFAFSNLTIIWGILGPNPILMRIWHFSYHHHQHEFYRIPILGHYFWNILCKLSKCNVHSSLHLHHQNLITNKIGVHSSEIRGLCSTKCSRETLQNLPYFWNTKTHIVFFVFHFVLFYFFP